MNVPLNLTFSNFGASIFVVIEKSKAACFWDSSIASKAMIVKIARSSDSAIGVSPSLNAMSKNSKRQSAFNLFFLEFRRDEKRKFPEISSFFFNVVLMYHVLFA